jgi:homoserine dehydrogenase
LSYFDLTTKNLKKYNNNQIQERIGSYYLRFTTEDKPGVIASISKEFKKYNISMKSMLQKEAKQKKQASIVVTTHSCKELFMQQAIKKINLMSFVKKKTILYRIEEI